MFNEDETRILASRFLIQTYQINDTNQDKDMMQALRNVADEAPFDVTVFHPYFVYFDQVNELLKSIHLRYCERLYWCTFYQLKLL